MTSKTSKTKQQLLASAPAIKREQIMAILNDVRALLANGQGMVAAHRLTSAKLIMQTVCNTAIPQAIRHHKAVTTASIIGTGKYKLYNAYTLEAGFVNAPTGKQWLAQYSRQAKSSAKILGDAVSKLA